MMSHLKPLLTGRLKSAKQALWNGLLWTVQWCCMEHSGEEIWRGRPHVINDAQLESLRRASQVKPHNSTGVVSLSVIVLNLWMCSKSTSRLMIRNQTLVNKPPHVLKEKWWFYVDDKDEDWPDLILFEKWLSRIAFVHEGFSAFKGERRDEDRRSKNRDKRFSKTSNFSASSNVKKQSRCKKITVRYLMALIIFWTVHMSMSDLNAAVRKQRSCYGCLGKKNAIKVYRVKARGINGCIKKHNRWLHSQNQTNDGYNAVNVSAETINRINEVTSFLQIVPVSIQSGGNRLNTFGFVDSGSTFSIIDQNLQEKLRAQSTDVTLNIAGIHENKDLKTEMVPLKIKRLHSKSHSIEAFPHPSISLGNTTYNWTSWSKASITYVFYPTKASIW